MVDPKEPTPGSRVAENDAIEGENGPRGGKDNTEVAVDPVDDVERKKLTSDPMDVDKAATGDEEVDGVKTKKPSSDLDLVKEGHCEDGAKLKKAFRVISEDGFINGDKLKEMSLGSALPVTINPESTLDPRQSSCIALAKPDYVPMVIDPCKPSKRRRNITSKKGEDLHQESILTAE